MWIRVQNVDQSPECGSESRMWIIEQKVDHRTLDGSRMWIRSRMLIRVQNVDMWIKVQNVDQRTECGPEFRMWVRVHAVTQLLFLHPVVFMISSKIN
jgi:hypothetical protein